MIERPYPGLRPFTREESFIFFGREEQTDQLLEKLGYTRFLSVVGLSGCGKSSLVRAGMIAALESGYLASAGAHWRVAAMRPGNSPVLALAKALLQDSALKPEQLPLSSTPLQTENDILPFLVATLRRGPLGLVDILHETPLPAETNLLLVVDQFEELFRYQHHENQDEIEAFVSLLLASAQQQEVPIYIVITMRSDFIGECAQFQELPEMLNAGQFLVPRLTRDQQRDAIVKPARVFDGEIAPQLVNHLLNEMGNVPDQLPVLQHCLMRMWTQVRAIAERQSEDIEPEPTDEPTYGAILLMKDYEEVGGLKHALSKHADEAFSELDEREQQLAERLFRCLSERSFERRDTRHPTALWKAARLAGVSETAVQKIVEVFRRSDRCFLLPAAGAPLQHDTMLDISHESLIQQWDRMNTWVEEEARSAENYKRLEQTARLWKAQQAALWTTPDLENALAWKKWEQPTPEWARRYGEDFGLAMEFLDASHEAQERQRKQEEQEQKKVIRRRFGLGLLIVLIAYLVGFLAVWGWQGEEFKRKYFESIMKQAVENTSKFAKTTVTSYLTEINHDLTNTEYYQGLTVLLVFLFAQKDLSEQLVNETFQEILTLSEKLFNENIIADLDENTKKSLSRVYYEFSRFFCVRQELEKASLAIENALKIARFVENNTENIEKLLSCQKRGCCE